MMQLKEVMDVLEQFAPLALQADYDNSGLLVGNENLTLTGAVITLDCTEAVVDEAIALGVNLIIAHHPIVFSGLKRFNGNDYIQRTVIKAIENKIAIYAIHTNLDSVPKGVNNKLGQLLGLSNLKILAENSLHPGNGAGMIGTLESPMNELNYFNQIKKQLKQPFLRHTALRNQPVKKVAFCGGSGSFLLEEAIAQKADVIVSSDFKYHQFFDADNQIVIVDVGHYEAEICTKDLIYEILREKFATFTLHFSKISTNPVNYL